MTKELYKKINSLYITRKYFMCFILNHVLLAMHVIFSFCFLNWPGTRYVIQHVCSKVFGMT